MAFIIVGIVVVLGGALIMLLATGRRRATTGRLSRETRQRDESTPPVGTELATVDESDEARARADEARAATGAIPAKRAKSGFATYDLRLEEDRQDHLSLLGELRRDQVAEAWAVVGHVGKGRQAGIRPAGDRRTSR